MTRWTRDKRGKAEVVAALRAQGKTRAQIIKETGISPSHVARLIAAYGMKKGATNKDVDGGK